MLANRFFFWNWTSGTTSTTTRRSNEGGGKKRIYESPDEDYWDKRKKHLERLKNLTEVIKQKSLPEGQTKVLRLEKRREIISNNIEIIKTPEEMYSLNNEIKKLTMELNNLNETFDNDILIVLLMSS